MASDRPLSWSTKVCFGLGHFLNDLTSAAWFSFFVPYLQLSRGFDAALSGWLVLVGQLADALATPFLGYQADVGCPDSCGTLVLGRKRMLHLTGTVCVAVSFPLLFSGCPGVPKSSQEALFVFLLPLVTVFQVGWAAVQVSHLALIPELSRHHRGRDLLAIVRYGFGVAANVSAYLIAWAVLAPSPKSIPGKKLIDPGDSGRFTLMSCLLTGLGGLASFVFHCGFRHHARDYQPPAQAHTLLARTHFLRLLPVLKQAVFYQVTALYTSVRVFHNFTMVFISLYLQKSLGSSQEYLAVVPLVMSLSGFLTTTGMRWTLGHCGRQACHLLGVLLGVCGCVWISLLDNGEEGARAALLAAAALLGCASALTQVTSLSYATQIAGSHPETGGLIYSLMSFCDKATSGLGVLLVQYLHGWLCKDCTWLYRYVLGYGAGGLVLFSGICSLGLPSQPPTSSNSGKDQDQSGWRRRSAESGEGDDQDSAGASVEEDERQSLLRAADPPNPLRTIIK